MLFSPSLDVRDRSLGRWAGSSERFQGKRLLSEEESFRAKRAVRHWRREIADALRAGMTVFLRLVERDVVNVHTGEVKYSGTGKNRSRTNIVTEMSNYEVLPLDVKIISASGTSMRTQTDLAWFQPYWRRFGTDSRYHVRIEGSPGKMVPLLTTRQGGRVVGATFREASGGGTLVCLPWIDVYREEFVASGDAGEQEWTDVASRWGQEYRGALLEIDRALRDDVASDFVPEWANGETFLTAREKELRDRMNQGRARVEALEEEQGRIGGELARERALRALLYGAGGGLERAIARAMTLMGFETSHYRDGDSEFDVVLECSEGRCIGEAEGRERRAIGIDKMRQLESNVLEDLARNEVKEPAKAVLFGNAHRLLPPDERDEHFTRKCRQAACRTGAALVRTCDLFEVAKTLADQADAEFAAACRRAILEARGTEVRFPRKGNSANQTRNGNDKRTS